MAGHGEHRREGARDTVRPGALSALLLEIAKAPASTVEPWDSGLHPGAVVGRFDLVRELGRGGFGIVWEARDRELGRRVAFKAVRSGAQRDLREERLLREAEAAARLAHPNLVTLLDVGRTDQGPYLVFELLDGETLGERLAKGPLPRGEALRIGVEIAKGVEHAHAQGVVHRDLKPGNVFLCRDGQVKVLDFGMAHAFGRRRVPGGTPAYMAPEQAKGAPEDERTDVWAMGAILFEALTGQRPFEDEKALWSSRPAPRLEVTGAPGLGELVAHALAKDPLARPRDAGELLEVLSAVVRELAPVAGAVRTRRRPRLRIWVPFVAGIGAVALVAGMAVWRGREHATPPQRESMASPVPSIAVLPFADLSPGKDQEYFADGVAEEMLNALSHVEGLHVAGRTSSFSFKGKTVDIREIGRQLSVRAVLEGSVRREGNRVRITAQVVDVANGYQLWSETYSRELTGIFAVQDDIARAVVEALKVKLAAGTGPGGGEGRTTNPESYNYYLMGLHHERQGTVEGMRRARAALEKALALDPGNAPAQAALAIAIFDVWSWGGTTTAAEVEDVRRESLAAAEKAVALAPSLADGYGARGFLRGAYFDWAGSRADLDRALALRPNDSRALAYLGEWQSLFGRVTESIALTRRALELDPLWERPLGRLCHLYLASGELSLARSAIDHWLEVNPDNAPARFMQVLLHLLEGNPEAALSAAQGVAAPRVRLLGIALAENDLGHAAESNRALEELTSKFAPAYPHGIAQVYAWRGDGDRAFEWLERAWRERDPQVARLKFDPLLRKIRGDPRYTALLRKMNLPVD